MHYKRGIKLKKVYMILEALEFMMEFEHCFIGMTKKIFLCNANAIQNDIIPENTIYQLRTWQYDLADIIEFYYAL